jgi:hypothetical protein
VRWVLASGALGVLVAGGIALYALTSTAPGPSGPGAVDVRAARTDLAFVIPAGTGLQLDRGERVELMPARIDARVGDVIRLENLDDRGYLLGPFYVGPQETLTQRFTSPGTFSGACAVQPEGELVLTVRP